MRVLLAALLLAGCAPRQPVAVAPLAVRIKPLAPIPAPWHDAAGYIMRADSDPATIAVIRHRLKTVRTAHDAKSLRAFIRNAPHVAR